MSRETPWSAGRPVLAGLVVVFGMLGGFVAWSCVARISGAVVAQGEVEVALNRQIVRHLDGGIVSEVLIAEGDRVAADAVMLRLDGTLVLAELSVIEGQLRAAAARRARLEAERDGTSALSLPPDVKRAAQTDPALRQALEEQDSLLRARRATDAADRAQLRRRQDQIAEQRKGLAAQLDAARSQLRLVRAELSDQSELRARGLTPASQVRALERDAAELGGRIGEIEAALAAAAGRATEIAIEIARIVSDRREAALVELGALAEDAPALSGRHRQLVEQAARLEVRAPAGGVVQELAVTRPGSVVMPAEAVLHLVPQDRPLTVVARIPTPAIDGIGVGHRVGVRLAGPSGNGGGDLEGRIATLSADAVTDPRTGVRYYRAAIELLPGQAGAQGDPRILPGMPVEVFIRTGDRSPMSYFLSPVTRYFYRALREG